MRLLSEQQQTKQNEKTNINTTGRADSRRGSLKAADFTVTIDEPVGPLGQWYLDYNLRQHIRLRDTREAALKAEWLLRDREEFQQWLIKNPPLADGAGESFRKGREALMRSSLKFKEDELKRILGSLADAKKPKKKKSLKAEELALAQALERLSEPEVRRAIPVAGNK